MLKNSKQIFLPYCENYKKNEVVTRFVTIL